MKNKHNPKISVVMSAFNSEATVGRAIESVLDQTLSNFEFIIVNDGSTDSTHKILKKYASEDKRIKLIYQENKGLTKSLNIAINKTESAYIVRQDADDFSLPRRFELQCNFFDEFDFICSQTKIGKSISPKWITSKLWRYVLPYKNPFIHGTFAFKKSLWKELGGYNESYRYAQDYDFVSRVVKKKYKIKYLSLVLYESEKNNSCISLKNKDSQADCFRRIRDEYWI